jgi:hypothetical protein
MVLVHVTHRVQRQLRTGLCVILLSCSGAIAPSLCLALPEDDGSVIRILYPTEGAMIAGNDLDLDFQFFKGELADHVHVYLDGYAIKELPRQIMGLSRGSHEIKLIAATVQHRWLKATATVHFVIK